MLNMITDIFTYASQLTFYSLNISSIVGKFIVSTLTNLLCQCTDFLKTLLTAIGICKEDFETFCVDVYGKLSFFYTLVATIILSLCSSVELLTLGFYKNLQLLSSAVWNVIYKNSRRFVLTFVFIKDTFYLITQSACFLVNSVPELCYFTMTYFRSVSYEAWLIVYNLFNSLLLHLDDIIIGIVMIVCFGVLLLNCSYLSNFLKKWTITFFGKIGKLCVRKRPTIKKSSTETDLRCVICHENDRSILLIPCRHLCLCDDCWNLFRNRDNYKCPLCRTYIHRHMKIYT